MTDATIVQRALSISDPVERKRYVESACCGKEELLRKIEKLVLNTHQVNLPSELHDSEQPQKWEAPYNYLLPPQRAESLGRLGHYEILSVLGEGGFGTVFRAWDELLNRVVAIKAIHPDLAAIESARKRFMREARAAAQIRHENVVQVYAIESEPIPYLVMEFVPGKSLQQLMDSSGALSTDVVIRYGIQIARGLAAAHSVGMIHRDIKPANILIDSANENRIKLTDFGLARAVDDSSLTSNGVIIGTPQYMSPEQASGHLLDHRSDLFSLGSVLYTMCTGKAPFRAQSSLAVLRRVADESPEPIEELSPSTPNWLCDIIAKLHSKNPEERFPSALALVKALETATAPLEPEQKQQPVQTRKRLIILGSLAGISLIALAIVLVLGGFGNRSAQGVIQPTSESKAEASATQQVTYLSSAKLTELLKSPDYEWEKPAKLKGDINTAARQTAPTLSADELVIVFSRQTNLYRSQRLSRDDPFQTSVRLPDSINQSPHESCSLSADGLQLIFSKNTRTHNEHLWISERETRSHEFGEPRLLSEPVNSLGQERSPVLTADGLSLYCTSTRPGVIGGGDILRFVRTNPKAIEFTETHPLGKPLNSELFETANWVSNDGRIVFVTRASERGPRCQICTRTTPEGQFDEPFSFGPLLDDLNFDRPWLSPDGQRLYFHIKEGEGTTAKLELFMSRRVRKTN